MQKEMSKLDKKMNQILKSDLEESEKIKQYNQVLQKYLSLKEKEMSSRLVIEKKEEEKPIPAKDILKGFTKKNLIQSKKILELIENNSSASWNSRGELVFDKFVFLKAILKNSSQIKSKKRPSLHPAQSSFNS